MKKILFAVALFAISAPAYALTEVQEAAGKALVGYISISSSTAVDIFGWRSNAVLRFG